MILVLKMTKQYTHNMILMSRYKGQLHGGSRVNKFGQGSSQCPKENFFFCRSPSLTATSFSQKNCFKKGFGLGGTPRLRMEVKKSKKNFAAGPLFFQGLLRIFSTKKFVD